mmetsp:Transcript_51576/g.116697  ORF Transcript_51576/g.116697 Transcript_51576/m.116697 type:complete len:205 (-) Transcript_51576:99-713(-)
MLSSLPTVHAGTSKSTCGTRLRTSTTATGTASLVSSGPSKRSTSMPCGRTLPKDNPARPWTGGTGARTNGFRSACRRDSVPLGSVTLSSWVTTAACRQSATTLGGWASTTTSRGSHTTPASCGPSTQSRTIRRLRTARTSAARTHRTRRTGVERAPARSNLAGASVATPRRTAEIADLRRSGARGSTGRPWTLEGPSRHGARAA